MSSNRLVFQAFKETCKNNILIVITLIISAITGIAMQLIPPQILRNIIDGYISKGITEGLWTLAYFYLLSVIVSGVADFIRELTMSIVGQNTLANIRYNMAKKLSKLPISYFSNNSAGAIMSYFTSDVDVVGTLLTSGVIGIMADGLKMLGIIVSIYMLSPILVLYVLILVPIIYVITRKFKKATLKAQIEARKAVGKINGYIQELFTGIRTIKIFNREKDFVDRFQEPLNENIKAVNKTSIFDSVFPCVMQVLRAIIIALVVIISAPAGLGAMDITIGSLAACVELVSRMLAPIESIAMEFQTIQEAISGLKRIQEFDSLQEEQRHIQEHINYEEKDTLNIRVDSLSFAYENGTEVVKDISFTIKPGTKVALIGKTGAGKSTILNLVAGLYEPSKGTIKVGDFNPFKIPANLRRRIMGIVPQNFNIYDGTIRDAITLYDKTITEEQIIRASKTVGLHDEIMMLPKGYDTIIGEGEVQLSHGQYQLLALACAIVCDPPILLLDEVTSGLDAVTEQKIFKVLREVSKNRTLLTISHRISGIIDADEVVILQRGRIIETGTPKELEGKEGWYAKYNQIEKLGWKIS
ncbi:ABC transporter ATP-binding protein [Desnuesiella massiliensis]|uniref:ABC transporter ATP-binding protein n=1 Tax=Desnuesiella massiliensis TaxID=1650662 RepID=UPI0006E439A5|nr:ABC transporter ATP-binding protein [Desnuesiella massiliensis]